MRFSKVSFYALCGATAVSARPGSCKKHRDPLTLEHFGNFTMISLDDARAGIVKSHNGTTSRISGYPSSGYPTGSSSSTSSKISDYPSSGYPTGGSSGNTYTVKPGHSTSSTSSGYNSSPSSPSSTSSGHSSSPSSTSAPILSSASTLSSSSASLTLSVDVPTVTASTAPAASTTAAATCEERTEWRSYSDADRHAFAAGLKCLMDAPASGSFAESKNRYEDLVRVHQMMTSTIHGNNIFLFWHRYYVWTLEQIMKDECSFDGAFPWWDETLDAGNFAGSSIFTSDFFGSLPGPTGKSGTCITDGYFANTIAHIGPGTGFQDHCLSRAVNETLTASCNEDFVTTCNSRSSYPDMENCAELGAHGYGHNGIGSVMADVSASPSDPTFFLHHLFIDRNFWLWQNDDETTRKSQINGCIDAASPCTPLTLDTVISVQGLRPDVTVKDIIDTENGAMCYSYSY